MISTVMPSPMSRLLLIASTFSAVQAQTAPAPNTVPQVPLRLIVTFTPGTGIDLIACSVGPRLAERLGRPMVVDNRAGASGTIGT